jgi:hypothetical protein
VGRVGREDEQDAVKAKLETRLGRQDEVAEVGWVEGAAKDA